MMQSSRNATPAWQRYVLIGLLAVLVVVGGFVLYTKEFKHSSTTSSNAPSTTVPGAAPAPATPAHSTTTTSTVPGGVAVSPNSPFPTDLDAPSGG